MSTLLATLCALSVQTFLGGATCGLLAAALDRRFLACWRGLRVPVVLSLAVASAALGLGWLSGCDPSWLVEPVRAILPGAFTAAGAVAATGCHLVLHAGRLEGGGRLVASRELVRAGGKTMFLGADLAVALTLASLLDPSGPTRAALASGGAPAAAALFLGASGCAAGGFAGLLAGISGKPRPSGPVAAGLYVAGQLVLVSAVTPS